MQRRPGHQLAHAVPPSEVVELVHPLLDVRKPAGDGEVAERVQAEALDPGVRVAQSPGGLGSLGEQLQSPLVVPTGGGQQTSTTQCVALPARIADLTGEGVGVLEGLGRPPDSSLDQVDLAEQ